MNAWEREVGEMVACPECAFAFSAEHVTQETGEYDCPVCEEGRLRDALREIQQTAMGDHDTDLFLFVSRTLVPETADRVVPTTYNTYEGREARP